MILFCFEVSSVIKVAREGYFIFLLKELHWNDHQQKSFFFLNFHKLLALTAYPLIPKFKALRTYFTFVQFRHSTEFISPKHVCHQFKPMFLWQAPCLLNDWQKLFTCSMPLLSFVRNILTIFSNIFSFAGKVHAAIFGCLESYYTNQIKFVSTVQSKHILIRYFCFHFLFPFWEIDKNNPSTIQWLIDDRSFLKL